MKMTGIFSAAYFICVTLIYAVSADRTYTVTAPKNVRPLTPYQAVVTIHNSPEPVTVHVIVECKLPGTNVTQETSGDITVENGETKILDLDVGEWKRGECKITAKGEGGIVFDRTTSLSFNGKLFSVFIQTDKAIYQPGQLVQFRVLVVDPKLKPYKTDQLNVHIMDAQRNRIKQWTNATLKNGIFSGELQLTDQPVLGDWSINAGLKDEEISKSFTVAEYVLPKFEVTVRPPSFGTFNESHVVISVDAKYTYGKPVKGKVLVNVTEDYCRRWQYSYCGSRPVVVNATIDGTAVVRIPIDDFSFQSYVRNSQVTLDVLAVVTEDLTGRTMNNSADVTIYNKKEKLDISQSSDSFKPGLRHSYTVRLQLQDGTPLNDATEPLVIKYSTNYRGDDNVLNYTIPSTGIVDVDVYPDEDAENLRLTANYKDISSSISTSKAQSISTKYLQLSMKKEDPKVGDTVDIEVNGTFYISRLDYEVVARGKILASGALKFKEDAKYQTFPITLTQEMAPRVRIVAYYVSLCGEVVVDGLDFSVEGIFQTPVELSTSENRTKPGSPLDVIVDTNPDAVVGLLAIDQSVLLLKSGNDIAKSQVISDLDNYESGWRPSYYNRRRRYIWRPPGETPAQLFDNAGLVFLSNGLFQKTQSYGGYGRPSDRSRIDMPIQTVSVPEALAGIPGKRPSSPEPEKPTVRKNFVETWIWTEQIAGKDGKAILKTTVPDTITSWVISAFAMDDETGLGLADGTKKVEVFRPFFVTLNLPYSVVRGEAINIQALVFNYMKEDIEAEVTLDNPDHQFELTGLQNRVDVVENATSEKKTVKVKAGDGASVSFLITPLVVGHIDLKVTAIAPKAGDALIRKLLVKAEGSPQYFNKALLVDLRNTSTFSDKVEISIPEFAVKDSEYIELSAIGDIMGPTVNNLDKLLRMPYGCGEQNMVNFVPNIVVADYLTKINQLTPELKAKAVKNMEAGYQRELTYKRYDGSFSAFGQSDNAGSTWLTAFVVRSFLQAKPYINIDKNVISRSLQYLADLQYENGTFPELGEVHSKNLQGGASSGHSLTAYVLLAFLENKDDKQYANETQRALKLLETEVDKIDDVYELSIISYALHVANSPAKTKALERLFKKSEHKGDQVFWTKPVIKPVNTTYWYYPPPAVDIEMTSYNLLSLVHENKIAESLPIMKWLIAQRNENGGFASTQDTVLGIQALAGIASHVTSPGDFKMNVKFMYNERSKELTLDQTNAIVLQKEQLPSETREVVVTGTGNGVGIVQITWSYNLDNQTSSPVFNIDPKLKKIDNETFELTACAAYNEDDESSNMAVIEFNLPSGYVVDSESLPTQRDYNTLKRVDTTSGGTKVEVYFDRIDNVPVCPHITAYRVFEVANVKPAAVSVYDYYDNAKRAETFYDAPKSSICSICKNEDCGQSCK